MTASDDFKPITKMPRIPLIDTLRGVALIAMASYHFTWDLEFFGYVDPGTATTGFFRLYARAIASSFLFLAGVSLVLAHYPGIRWNSFWKRFAMVAGAALAISIATLIAVPAEWIYFGILHNIALSSLIGLAFLSLPPAITGLVALIVIAAMIVDNTVAPGLLRSAMFDARYLSWTGFAELTPRSNDFVPLFPWVAALLTGITFTRVALQRNWLPRLAAMQAKPNLLSIAGRHSLVVYLIHQPILIALVYLFSLVSPPALPDPRQTYVQSCEAGCTAEGNDSGLCQRFCGCTADALANQSLLLPMQQGTINPQTDERVVALAQECSATSR